MLGHQSIECGDRLVSAMVKEMRRDRDQSRKAEPDQPVSDARDHQGAKSRPDSRPHGRIIIQRPLRIAVVGS